MKRTAAAGAGSTGGVWRGTGGGLRRSDIVEARAGDALLEGCAPCRREKVPFQGLKPRGEVALGRYTPRNGLWPMEDPCWSKDTPQVTLKVEQKKKSEKEGVVENESKKQGVTGRSHYMLNQTSSIPLPQGSRVACGESKGSGDKERVEICCTEIKSGQKMCFPKRFWGLFFGLGIVGFF